MLVVDRDVAQPAAVRQEAPLGGLRRRPRARAAQRLLSGRGHPPRRPPVGQQRGPAPDQAVRARRREGHRLRQPQAAPLPDPRRPAGPVLLYLWGDAISSLLTRSSAVTRTRSDRSRSPTRRPTSATTSIRFRTWTRAPTGRTAIRSGRRPRSESTSRPPTRSPVRSISRTVRQRAGAVANGPSGRRRPPTSSRRTAPTITRSRVRRPRPRAEHLTRHSHTMSGDVDAATRAPTPAAPPTRPGSGPRTRTRQRPGQARRNDITASLGHSAARLGDRTNRHTFVTSGTGGIDSSSSG